MIIGPPWQPQGSVYKVGSVRPSVCPGISLSVHFHCIISFFLNFGMILETHLRLCLAEQDIPEKNFLPPKLGKRTKNGQKQGFF